jgi:hypothetical protein
MKYIALVLVFASALSLGAQENPGADKPVVWQDRAGGNYMYLPGKRTFQKASLACGNRGWTLFNPQYLDDADRAGFYASPVYAALPSITRFVGEPGEIWETSYWTSSQTETAASVAVIKKIKIEAKARLEYVQYSTSGDDETGAKHAVICMHRGAHWYNCSAEQVCTMEKLQRTPGNPAYWYPLGSVRRRFYESGETEGIATDRVRKRSVYQTTSPDYKNTCIVDPNSVMCDQER